jgi:hypothetical protein
MTNDGMPSTCPARKARHLGSILVLTTMSLLAGCASTPPPRGLLDGAQRAIADARSAQAQDFAPVELGHAQERVSAARAAMAERDYDLAAQYSLQAELDARLAQTRSEAARGREEIKRRTDENARLRGELLGEGGR